MQSLRTIKVVTLGDVSVGKTSLIKRYVDNEFYQEEQSTIGSVYMEKIINYGDSLYKLQIYDTAGQERFQSIAKLYYQKADVALLLYDITNQDTFDTLKNWNAEVMKNAPSKVIRIVVGNKIDLLEKEAIDQETAEKYAKNVNALFSLVSAKTNAGVRTLFEKICQEYSLRFPIVDPSVKSSHISLNNNVNGDEKSSKCAC